MEKKRFERSEFEELLNSATERCLQNFEKNFAKESVSRLVKYVVSELKTGLLNSQNVMDHLLREDGMFRPTIRLTPFARTSSETVIDVSWGDDAMRFDEWTDVLLPKDLRNTYDPFLIMTPSLDDLSAEDMKRFESGKAILEKISLPNYL